MEDGEHYKLRSFVIRTPPPPALTKNYDDQVCEDGKCGMHRKRHQYTEQWVQLENIGGRGQLERLRHRTTLQCQYKIQRNTTAYLLVCFEVMIACAFFFFGSVKINAYSGSIYLTQSCICSACLPTYAHIRGFTKKKQIYDITYLRSQYKDLHMTYSVQKSKNTFIFPHRNAFNI